jgi:DNA-directed RNA polymerase specialized sigma24 family protein
LQLQLHGPPTIQQKGDSMFSSAEDETQEFHKRFLRCRGLLYLIASRVLDGGEGVDEAVENCFLKAIGNPQEFESEGSFRSWLLRILIDEALQILRQKNSTSTASHESVCSEQC